MKLQTTRTIVAAFLLLIHSCWASPATAAPKNKKPVEGRIVQIADGELIVDIGLDAGLPKAARVKVFRRLEVTHPVTKKTVVDRFLIGEIQLQQVGEVLSITRNYDKLARPAAVGDFVVFDAPAVSPVILKPAKTKSNRPVRSKADPEKQKVDETFYKTLGQPITTRIELWETFLAKNPKSPYAEAVNVEVTWLRGRLDAERRLAEERAQYADDKKEAARIRAASRASSNSVAPKRAPVNSETPVVATFRSPQNVAQARLLVREFGKPTYETIDMQPNGDTQWSVNLPAELVQEPGVLEYSVEAVRKDGQLERAENAGTVEVYTPPQDPAPRPNRSRARVTGEFVNFNLGSGTDEYWRAEADYRYDLGLGWLEGFRVGAGIFNGTGASVSEIAANEDSRSEIAANEDSRFLSLGYGFAEVDSAIGDFWGLGFAMMLGNRQGDDIDTFESSVGVRGFLRIGKFDGTRLTTGLAFIGGLGSEAWMTLDLLEIPKVPMEAEVVVTNLPVGEDLGVSLKYGAGYEFYDGFSVLGHVGWNARTINHHGPGAGLSLNINW